MVLVTLLCVDIWLGRTSGSVCLSALSFASALVMPSNAEHICAIEAVLSHLQRAPVLRRRDPTRALKRDRIVTCVIWALSSSAALAEAYLLSKGVTDTGTTVEDNSPERTVLLFTEWLVSEQQSVLIAMMDMGNDHRVAADCFLVRSLTAMIVHMQSQKGVVVSTSDSVYHYLRFWSLRPVAIVLQPALRRLTYHFNTRRKFGQLLRREWMLDHGSFKAAADISEQETQQRALRSATCNLAC